MRLVIIGGIAAGTSAAAKARRTNEDLEIILLEKGEHISVGSCGLPYYISQVIQDHQSLVLGSPAKFANRNRLEVRTGHEVTRIDPTQRRLQVKNLHQGEEYQLDYDRLVIATGASPIKPPIPGIDQRNVFTLRTVDDAVQIRKFIEEEAPKNVVVVGGGLIGLETAEAFREIGLEVTVVELAPQILTPFSPEMAQLVAEHLKEHGVKLHLGDGVKEFIGQGRVEQVLTNNGTKLAADLVLLSIGIQPNTHLAQAAGIETGIKGAIRINERLETSIADIYAVGDCAESIDLITGEPVWIPLGSTANKQGRTAGTNAAGGDAIHRGVMKTAIAKVMDLTVARTGLSEKEAEDAGFDPLVVRHQAGSHAGYYPGAEKMTIKGVFDQEDGRLLGMEIVGPAGVDKRIDLAVSAIYNQMTAEELFQLDLAYAPPYSSPKDPIVITGMIAANMIQEGLLNISARRLKDRLEAGAKLTLIDVRTRQEFEQGHFPHAINIPLDELKARLPELSKDQEMILYCRSGHRSYQAQKLLSQYGYRHTRNLTGGILAWEGDLVRG